MTKTLKQIHSDLLKLVSILNQHNEFLREMRESNRLDGNRRWLYIDDQSTHLQFVLNIEKYMDALSYIDAETEVWLSRCPVINTTDTDIEVQHFSKIISQIEYRIKEGYGDKPLEKMAAPILN